MRMHDSSPSASARASRSPSFWATSRLSARRAPGLPPRPTPRTAREGCCRKPTWPSTGQRVVAATGRRSSTRNSERRPSGAMVRSAIDEDLLRVHYQPIVDLRTGRVVLAEALVRIKGPEELISPDLFVDIAEESGLLVTVDGYVLERAVQQMAAWSRELAPTGFHGVAVNITGRHLSDS